MPGAARIDSPDVIREFRTQFVKFDAAGRLAIADIRGDVRRIVEWLQHEQASYWRQEIRKSEELVLRARNDYQLARYGSQSFKKTSYVDEERILRKAQLRLETAQRKLAAVKRWARVVEQQADKLIGPVTTFDSLLATRTPEVLARLDFLVRQLEAYFRESAPAGGADSA